MKRNFWCCLLSINCLWLNAQSAGETLVFAREQASAGNTEAALKAYQRVLFFARDRYAGECYAQLATLFAQSGSYTQSAFYYDLQYHAAPNDSVRYEALFGKTGVLLLQQEYQKALIELLGIDENIPEPWRSRRHLYLGASYFGARDFDAAHLALVRLLADSSDIQKREALDRMFAKARKMERKSAKVAVFMSIIVPGTGQLYAGDVKNGLNSMLLNGALALGFVAMANTYSFSDAALTVSPWLFRYYAGGFKRAGKIVEIRKSERLRKNFEGMLDLLER